MYPFSSVVGYILSHGYLELYVKYGLIYDLLGSITKGNMTIFRLDIVLRMFLKMCIFHMGRKPQMRNCIRI